MGAFQNWGTLSRRTDSKGSRWMQMVSCIFLNIFEMVSLFQPKGDWNVLRFSDPIYSVGAQNDSLWGLWVSRLQNQHESTVINDFCCARMPFPPRHPRLHVPGSKKVKPIHRSFGKLRNDAFEHLQNLWRFRVVTSPTWTELVAEASMVSASAGVCLGWRLRMLGSPRQQIWGWELWARFLGNQESQLPSTPTTKVCWSSFSFIWLNKNESASSSDCATGCVREFVGFCWKVHMGVSENSVPLNPMVNDHCPY